MANYSIKNYRGIHNWVERRLGKPKRCDVCLVTEDKMYHWANISGQYKKELSDWRRLCVPCHMIEASPLYCKNGHERSEDNTRYRKNGYKECLLCTRVSWARYNEKMRLA